MADMTIREVDAILKKRGQKCAVSFFGGQYHVYAFQGESMASYDRGEDLNESFERVLGERPTKT
jgi:hypothetical protein